MIIWSSQLKKNGLKKQCHDRYSGYLRVPGGTMAELRVFAFLLVAAGIQICRAGWKSSVLCAVMVVEIMQLSYGMVQRYFSDVPAFLNYKGMEKQDMFLSFIPILMIFIMEEYINSVVYSRVVTDVGAEDIYPFTSHYQMLVIQLLGTGSLFCILLAYKKLLQGCHSHAAPMPVKYRSGSRKIPRGNERKGPGGEIRT